MDDPGAPAELREGALRNLRTLNRYLGGYRCALKGLRRLVRRDRLTAFSLLEVGAGSADIAGGIAGWARYRRLEAKVVALDLDPVAARLAGREGGHANPISVVRGDAAAPPFGPGSFDFVLASQFLHHFSEEKNVEMLRAWAALARRAIIVSDLLRHPLAYHGIRLVTRLFSRNVITITDAPLSVARSFTLAEWRALLRRAAVGRLHLAPVVPFRVLGRLEVSR
jgi:SAM-dependent methyltransferase